MYTKRLRLEEQVNLIGMTISRNQSGRLEMTSLNGNVLVSLEMVNYTKQCRILERSSRKRKEQQCWWKNLATDLDSDTDTFWKKVGGRKYETQPCIYKMVCLTVK